MVELQEAVEPSWSVGVDEDDEVVGKVLAKALVQFMPGGMSCELNRGAPRCWMNSSMNSRVPCGGLLEESRS